MNECFSHSFVLFYTDHQSAENICSEDDLRSTIMDKSVGTVVQFERFLVHAILHPRVTNTARSYPLLPPYGQWVGKGEGTCICKMAALLFATLLVKRI